MVSIYVHTRTHTRQMHVYFTFRYTHTHTHTHTHTSQRHSHTQSHISDVTNTASRTLTVVCCVEQRNFPPICACVHSCIQEQMEVDMSSRPDDHRLLRSGFGAHVMYLWYRIDRLAERHSDSAIGNQSFVVHGLHASPRAWVSTSAQKCNYSWGKELTKHMKHI